MGDTLENLCKTVVKETVRHLGWENTGFVFLGGILVLGAQFVYRRLKNRFPFLRRRQENQNDGLPVTPPTIVIQPPTSSSLASPSLFLPNKDLISPSDLA